MSDKRFMDFVLAIRETFEATNGRIPTKYLDAFISKTWPQMHLKEEIDDCVLCQSGDGDHIHTEEQGRGRIFLEDDSYEEYGFGD